MSLDYKILDINKAALNFYQWRKKLALGHNYLELCKKNNFPCPIFRKKSLLLSGKIVKDVETVIEVTEKEKSVLWDIECSYDGNMQPDGFVLIGKDITQVKTEQNNNDILNKKIISYRENLNESQNKLLERINREVLGDIIRKDMNIDEQIQWVSAFLNTIISRMPGYVFWKDNNMTYLGCNDNLKEITGMKSRKDIIGKNDYYFAKQLNWDKSVADKIRSIDKEILLSSKTQTSQENLKTHNNKTKILLTNKTPIKDSNNKNIGILAVSIDITKQKDLERKLLAAKEKAEKANEAKSAFLAMMSHEFRTPLNGIFGIAQSLIQKDNLTTAQKKQLEIILMSGNHLVSLINDILDFSKLEAGKLELNFEEFDLRLLIRETAGGLQHLFEENGLKLKLKYSDDINNMVVADPKRIRQIVINLIGNAVKFTEKGTVTIAVEPGDDKNHIRLSVVDTGIGIPESKINTIFDRFSQIDADKYGRKYGGSGLGLAICKQLIAGMKGEIGATSKLHKGSTFWLSLPLDLKASGKISKKEEKSKTNALRQIMSGNHRPLDKPCYLLLIEDNNINQMVAQLLFDDLGIRYDIASDGPEGLELFAKNNYDIICTDIGLPGMNGIEVIKNIRADKRGKKVPVVALTAHVMDEDEKIFTDAGADDVLEKPIIFDTVKAMIRKWTN